MEDLIPRYAIGFANSNDYISANGTGICNRIGGNLQGKGLIFA